MNKELTEKYWVSAGDTNAERELALTSLTGWIIDIATAHANQLGIGNPQMPDPAMGWVLSRLTIEMASYPLSNTFINLTTWVESWNRHFSERCFMMTDDEGKVLGYARSVWMVLDTHTRRNAGLSSLHLSENMISDRVCPVERQSRFRMEKGEVVGSHRFQYSDLDGYRHVNTLRYIELLLNCFTLEDFDRAMPGRFELSFMQEARYGSVVDIERDGEHLLLRRCADNTPLLHARIHMIPRR